MAKGTDVAMESLELRGQPARPVLQRQPGTWQTTDLAGFASQVQRARPSGLASLLIGQRPMPAFQLDSGGGATALLGVPAAVAGRLCAGPCAELYLLLPAMQQGGRIAVAMGDGSVRPLAQAPAATAPTACKWELSEFDAVLAVPGAAR